jgi:hypothetical protein
MPANKPSRQLDRCIYCGSTTRGKGCRYAPHGVHFFPDDPRKCAYCGSTNYGRGCHVNPTGDTHVHGINYNSMFKESLQSFLDNEIFINEIRKDYKEFAAYNLGIIDENGNKIKAPVNEAEQAAYSPMIKTIIRLKKYLGAKADLLEANALMEKRNFEASDVAKYKRLLEFQDRVDGILNELYNVFDQAAQEGLAFEEIKKLIKA